MAAAGQGGSRRPEPDSEHREQLGTDSGTRAGPGPWVENTWEGPAGWGGPRRTNLAGLLRGQTKVIKAGDEEPLDGEGRGQPEWPR